MKKISELLASLPLLLFGVLPSLAFFIWIERNMALPWVGTWIGWPWVFIEGGLVGSVTFDLILIATFGWIHSALAGRAPRTVYTIVAGVTAMLVMAGWQPTGIILYQVIPSAKLASFVSIIVYWTLLGIGARSLSKVESPARFLGIDRTKTMNPMPTKLWTGGLYGYVRHPIYTLTLAAWLLTPMMSLDRLVFVLGMSAYLSIGIRREEKRMVEQFGRAYLDYRSRTPMLFPRLRGKE